MVTYGGTTYYYATNLQGDVVAILNGSGTAVVSYTYDAWGNVLSTSGSLASTLGTHNPLRYRGYVYDAETELYYVSSRYYDPSLNRFINADVLISTGQGLLGYNMFAYCRNNPVSRKDISGRTDVAIADDPVKDLMNNQFEQGGGAFGSGNAGAGYGFLELIRLIVEAITEEPPAIPEKKKEKEKVNPEKPNVTYPGDDPTKAPDGYEWKGKGKKGSKEGSYYKKETGESLHPDFNHPDGIKPHWDYNYRGSGVKGWRIFRNGEVQLKP